MTQTPLYLISGASPLAAEAVAALPPQPEVGAKEFSSAFENAAIGMALVAPDSRRLRVNRAFCTMLGYTEAQLTARTLGHITHPDDVAEDLDQRRRCLSGEVHTYHREKRYLHRDGRVLWGHLTCTLVRDDGGRPMHFISQVQDITERKRAEEALRHSEERFRSLTMLSSDWYWEQDEHLRFTSFSGNANIGPRRAGDRAAIGKRRWELQGYQPAHGSWEEHRALLEAHLPFHDLELVHIGPDGRAGHVSCSGEPVFDSAGTFRGYRGTARDISPRKQAEQHLRDAQALLHMAAQMGRLGAWAYEVGQPTVTWSEEACAIHEVRQGFTPTSQQALAFFAPEFRRAMQAHLRACLRDGSPFDVEAKLITAKGRPVWVRVIGEAEWDARGRVRRILGACQDISELRRASEEARLMARRLTTTLESLTDAFFTIDRDWRFTYVNAEAERMTGRDRGELLGRRVFDMYPELAELGIRHELERAMAEHVTVELETYYPPSDIWVLIKAFPSEHGLAVDIKDVSDGVAAQREIMRLNAELEERVRQRTAQLEAANKELEAFSYSIAHDLRAPLSSIDGFSQMLEAAVGTDLKDRSGHYLRRIRGGVRQMGELTDGLLALSNLSRASLRHEPVDLAVLARAAVSACREGSPERVVDVAIAPSLPAVGDPRLLSQVIGNLVGNAWKFTARQERARIEVGSACAPDGSPVYFVRDNGAGFEMAYASKMFEAFQRVHSSAEFEGTGIGLAIVHKIVTRHGGRVWAESAPDRGATFHFSLGRG